MANVREKTYHRSMREEADGLFAALQSNLETLRAQLAALEL